MKVCLGIILQKFLCVNQKARGHSFTQKQALWR